MPDYFNNTFLMSNSRSIGGFHSLKRFKSIDKFGFYIFHEGMSLWDDRWSRVLWQAKNPIPDDFRFFVEEPEGRRSAADIDVIINGRRGAPKWTNCQHQFRMQAHLTPCVSYLRWSDTFRATKRWSSAISPNRLQSTEGTRMENSRRCAFWGREGGRGCHP